MILARSCLPGVAGSYSVWRSWAAMGEPAVDYDAIFRSLGQLVKDVRSPIFSNGFQEFLISLFDPQSVIVLVFENSGGRDRSAGGSRTRHCGQFSSSPTSSTAISLIHFTSLPCRISRTARSGFARSRPTAFSGRNTAGAISSRPAWWTNWLFGAYRREPRRASFHRAQ